MPPRRILSLWFPRLAAERVLRAEPQLAEQPLAVVADVRGALVLASLDRRGRGGGAPARHGARRRPRDLPRPRHPARGPPPRRRPSWRRSGAGRAASAPGSPRRAGGAGARHHRLRASLRRRGGARRRGRGRGGGLRPERSGSASPTRSGAAWAVARYAGAGALAGRMPATPSTRRRAPPARAPRSARWERGGAPPPRPPGRPGPAASCRRARPSPISAPLPVAALRLEPEQVAALQSLGLRRIEDVAALPRAQLARRLGPAGGAPARPGARPRARAGLAGAAAARSSRCA